MRKAVSTVIGALALAFIMVFTPLCLGRSTTQAYAARSNVFRDVSSGTPHYSDIIWLYDQGISTGFGSGSSRTFQPYSDVARCDMAAFLYRLAGSPSYKPSAKDKAYFSDVNSNTPHAKEIWWLASKGISTGWTERNGTHTFRPYDSVARCDMAAFLYRLAGSPSFSPSSSQKRYFSDINSKSPHAKEVWWLASVGISTGWTEWNGAHTFRPYENVARCDMAAFLQRLGEYFSETRMNNRSTWSSRMSLPSANQIISYHTDTRSPYLVCWPQFPASGWYQYAVDFKADTQPRGTYLSIGCWKMDTGALQARYGVSADEDVSPGLCYAGFQFLDDGSTVAIFSIWNVFLTDSSGHRRTLTAEKIYPSNPRVSQPFDGEGTGIQTIVDYNWRAGRTYRALVQCGRADSGNTSLEFWVCDLTTGEWTLLIKYDLGYSDTYMYDVSCFLENYLPNYASGVRTAELSNFRACSRETGTWVPATSAYMERQYSGWTGSYSFGSNDSCFWMIATGVPNKGDNPGGGTYYVSYAESGSPF